jgi:hypothetical protein
MTQLRVLLLLLCAACAGSALARADERAVTVWDEEVSGDLANVGASPTLLTLELGSNLLIGRTGRTAGVVDRDYFSFTLPAGWQLDTLSVLPGTTAVGTSGLSFIAVQAGTQVTVNPTGGSAAGLLGWAHYGENDVGTDILQIMGFGPGASGFTGSLPAGSYAFWIQDTGTGVANYRLDFGVSAVPEPAAAWLMLAGAAGLLGWRRRSA